MNPTTTAGPRSGPPPSIGSRLGRALLVWAIVWGLAVGGTVLLVATHEVEELLDDTLQSSAELMAVLVAMPGAGPQAEQVVVHGAATEPVERFAWQVTSADGALLMRSARAPDTPWRGSHRAGFSSSDVWRIYGIALGPDGRMLHVAQTHAERQEAELEIALVIALTALTIGLLGQLRLRARVRTELEPLRDLSTRLAKADMDRVGGTGTLGPAQRAELQPVHDAIEALTERLRLRIANEQAFAAHAAHALRTPLAGIDAQLAVALRETPPALAGRLQRIRDAATHLQGVVAALLALFRSGAQPQRDNVDVAQMLTGLPIPRLDVQVMPGLVVDADPDLLAAALLNLLDNARRHGATYARVESTPVGLRVHDDGPGASDAQRTLMQASLDAMDYEAVGLGLMLADRVARAHGGRLRLPSAGPGFVVDLDLGEAAPPHVQG